MLCDDKLFYDIACLKWELDWFYVCGMFGFFEGPAKKSEGLVMVQEKC